MPENEKADPQTLADLHWAEQCCVLFEPHGLKLDRWEAYCLVKTDRALLCDELKRLGEFHDINPTGPVSDAVASRLRNLRGQLGSVAAGLRRFMSSQPALRDTMAVEMALALIMSSETGRSSASRWVANPNLFSSEAIARIGVVAQMVDNYRKLLVQVRSAAPAVPKRSPISVVLSAAEMKTALEAPPASPPPPAPAPAPEAPAAAADLLEDLQHARRARDIAAPAGGRAEAWELLYLFMVERRRTRATVEELYRSQSDGRSNELQAVVRVLDKRLQEIRARHGAVMDDLRAYLEKLVMK